MHDDQDDLRSRSDLVRELAELRRRVSDLAAREERQLGAESELRRSVDRYDRASISGLVGFWEWHLETGEIHVDPILKQILGFEDHEVPNRIEEWSRRVHPLDRDYVTAAARAHLDGKRPRYECEHRMIHKDGSIRWFLARGAARRDEAGRPVALVGSDTDITAVKQAHHETLMLAVPDLHFRLTEDGTYLDWMPSRELKPYVAPSEFLGRNIADVLPGDVASVLRKTIRDALGSGSTQTCEYRLQESGAWHDYEARVVPLNDHEVLAIVREVTERKKKDEALRQSERRLVQFLDAMPVGVFVLTAEGIAHYANRTAQEILGKGILPVGTGKLADTYAAYLAGSDRPYPQERMPIVRALAGESTTVDDMEIRRPDRTIPVEVNAAPIYDAEGRIEYAIAAFSDQTDRRRAEERLKLVREAMRRSERLASLGTLASGIAHEINNPLGSILVAARNAVEARKMPGGDEQVAMCLDTIIRNTKRCADIVKSVLQFSRRQPSEKRAGDLNATVERALDLIREYASGRGVGIETRLAKRLPEIRFSPVEMEQVIVNLIKNAVESGEGVRVTVGTEAGPDVVRLRVSDDGRGMGGEGLRHLFDPFYTTRQEEGGSGLGLSIVHGIVSDHEGTIEVTSSPGGGSEFLVSLPARGGGSGGAS